ncbi:MAG: 4'-phosphopantetheinyl transferase superfamily protein [candidate division KSB1 bacterium]
MLILTPHQSVEVFGAVVLAEPRVDHEISVELGPSEQRILNEMPWPHRRREWLSGRHVAKTLLSNVLELPMSRIQVLPAESGAPLVFVDEARISDWVVNLSHTTQWVAAAVSRRAVGIDVCDVVDGQRIDRIASRVFSPGEVEACGGLPTFEEKAAVWAMKEAGLKLRIGGVFQPGARSIRVLSVNPPVVADQSMQMSVMRLPDAMVALAVENVELI